MNDNSSGAAGGKAAEIQALHDRLRRAVEAGEVQIYTDQRMLDFQGSPVHNGWDHLLPLMVLMTLALAILLATGVAFGIVAMTVGALAHLLGIKHYVAWRLRRRTAAYVLISAAHWQQVWNLGGIAVYMPQANEPPCLAPRGDWRRFVQRTLGDDAVAQRATTDMPTQPEPPVVDRTGPTQPAEQEILPP